MTTLPWILQYVRLDTDQCNHDLKGVILIFWKSTFKMPVCLTLLLRSFCSCLLCSCVHKSQHPSQLILLQFCYNGFLIIHVNANLCFALAFCLSVIVSLLIHSFLSCLMFFFVNPCPLLCTLPFVVCYRLLSSDQSSAPKPLPAQNPCSKILHHDWLLWRWPCPALPLWPACPALSCTDWWLPPRCLSVIGCGVGAWCSSPKYGLLADRYHFCEKCFNEIQGETVSLGDDPSQPQT